MAANGGDIVVQLQMDDGQFRVAVVKAGDLVRSFKTQVDQAANSVKKMEEHTQSMGRRFRDLVLTLGNLRFVAMDINDVFLRLPMAILRTAGELEKMQQLMTGLSKETELAQRRMEGLRDMNFVIGMAKNAPFEIQALSDSFVKLKTAGVDPTNGSMQALVDSVARFGGSGEMLKRASVAIQQMAGKGVISMEELRQQLGEAVPTAMKAMAEGMEMSMADLAKIVSTGTLQAGPALKKMFLRMQIDNAGAAAEMMDTWVGMTSRLKTEWDLTAQYVAQNGFMQASKDAVGELISMLRSPEFKEFGAAFGQLLGGSVQSLAEVARALMRYREEIGLLVKAWLAYKLVTKINAPLGKAIEDATKSNVANMRREAQMLMQTAGAKERLQRQEATNAMYAAEAHSRALATKLSNDQKELSSVRARNAAVLAEDNRLRGQLQALRTAEAKMGANNYGQQQSILRTLDALSLKNGELLKRERELQQALPATAAAMNASRAAARAKAAEIAALTRGMTAARIATVATTVAVGSFNAVMNFLGGPVGLAITAIMGLVYWWNKTRDAAREAGEAQKRALAGTSTEEDVAILQKEVERTARDLEAARQRMSQDTVDDASQTGTGRRVQTRLKNEAERAADRAAFMRALEADREMANKLQRARTTVEEQGAELRANNRMVDLDRELRDMDHATQRKVAKIKGEKDAYIKAHGETSKQAVAEIAKFNRQQAAVVEEGLVEQLARARNTQRQAELSVETKGLSGVERLERQRAAALAGERVTDLESRLKGVREALAAQTVYSQKKDKDTAGAWAVSPLEALTERLAAEREGLEAEIAGLDGLNKGGDKIGGVIAKLWQQYEDGKFDVKGKRPGIGAFNQALQNAVDVQALKNNKDEIEKAAKDIERITGFVESMRPEIDAAAELLADPLGTAKRGALQGRVEKFLAKNKEALETYARDLGQSTGEAYRQLVGDAQRADVAGVFAKTAQETEQINAAMVDDSRLAAKARAEADLARHQQAMQALIDERALAGATVAEIAQLQNILSQSMVARAKTLQKQFESPMQKLATQWANTAENMERATEGWANATLDAFHELVTTGKADFRGLVTSILSDLARIQLQKAMSPFLELGGNLLTSFIGSMIPGMGAAPSSAGSSYSLGSGNSGLGLRLGGRFANGGIMTEFGPAPLRKYAAGGIANSPQLALYGEGSMPEAYVPLPDGRTIPVTVKGSSGQGVAINITVHQNGTESSSSRGADAGSYKRMGERIKLVVREELANQSRPGGMLYR